MQHREHTIKAAQYILSCYVLSGKNNTVINNNDEFFESIRVSLDSDLCPKWLKDTCIFYNTALGYFSPFLLDVIFMASYCELIENRNMDKNFHITIKPLTALKFLSRLGENGNAATEFGKIIRQEHEKFINLQICHEKK